VLARQRVLHLGEAHEAGAREYRGRALQPLAATGQARDEAVELRDALRPAAPEAAGQPEGVIREQHVVQVSRDAAARARLLLGAVVRARQRRAGMREGVELEVVVAQRQLLEALERARERRRRIDSSQCEGGHALERDLGDHPERAEPDTRPAEQLTIALGRALERRSVGEH
jgi:hypothetical protein